MGGCDMTVPLASRDRNRSLIAPGLGSQAAAAIKLPDWCGYCINYPCIQGGLPACETATIYRQAAGFA